MIRKVRISNGYADTHLVLPIRDLSLEVLPECFLLVVSEKNYQWGFLATPLFCSNLAEILGK